LVERLGCIVTVDFPRALPQDETGLRFLPSVATSDMVEQARFLIEKASLSLSKTLRPE